MAFCRLRFLSLAICALALILHSNAAMAQKAPDAAYAFPGGGRAGDTIEVGLGGYDFTPDMQFFISEGQVPFKVLSPPGPILITPPPYWFGPKSRNPPHSLPREVRVQLSLPTDLPEGPIDWQVANAGGTSAPALFWVGHLPEVVEKERRKESQSLPALPLVVNGRIATVEEVDRYSFSVPQATLVTCELFCRRLGTKMNGMLEVREEAGKLIADAADTAGRDLELTFAALPNKTYTLSLHDLDFNGDWSFVYRLKLTTGPRVLAAFPAAGNRGESRPVKFVGLGLVTGSDKLESVSKPVSFPSEPGVNVTDYQLETSHGPAQDFQLQVSDLPETIEPDRANPSAAVPLTLPAAVTGGILRRAEIDRYSLSGKKGDVWDILVAGRQTHKPFDALLIVTGPDGKEVGRNDDAGARFRPSPRKRQAHRKILGAQPATTDAALTFTLSSDGTYTLAVSDLSSLGGSPVSVYRMTVQKSMTAERPDFTFDVPRFLNVPIGGKASLPVKVLRSARFDGPINLAVNGLPAGVTIPTKLVIPEKKNELVVEVQCAASAASNAVPLQVQGTIQGAVALAEQSQPVLLATTLKPRCYLAPLLKNGIRTAHRGATFPAPVVVKRLEGYTGEVLLQTSSQQVYQVQGVRRGELVVPPGVSLAHFNIFMPEWLEIDRGSWTDLIGVCKVPDPQGKVRHVVTQMDGRIVVLLEGSLLSITQEAEELSVKPGGTVEVPLRLYRSSKLQLPVKLELITEPELAGLVHAEVITVPPEQSNATFRILSSANHKLVGDQILKIRGTTYEAPDLPVVSEVNVPVEYVAP